MKRIPQEAKERQRAIAYYEKHGNVRRTAQRYHMSRQTLHKGRNRWDGTLESLMNQSRAPHHTRAGHGEKWTKLVRRLCKKMDGTDIIRAYQEAHQRYGYPFTYQAFKRKELELREGKKARKKKRHNKPYERATYPGQKVQIDVKFVPAECSVTGVKYYVYIAVDECSRWAFRQMYNEHSTHSSALFLEALVNAAPFQIRMIQTDNGTEFTKALISNDPNAKTSFELRLEEYGILYHRIKPATPQHNGKVERQNRLDQDRFYDHLRMYSLEDGRKQLAVYQKKSNTYWKQCLGMKSPNDVIASYQGVM